MPKATSDGSSRRLTRSPPREKAASPSASTAKAPSERSSTSSSDESACFSVTFATLLFTPQSAEAPSASAYPTRGFGRGAAGTGNGASDTARSYRCSGSRRAD